MRKLLAELVERLETEEIQAVEGTIHVIQASQEFIDEVNSSIEAVRANGTTENADRLVAKLKHCYAHHGRIIDMIEMCLNKDHRSLLEKHYREEDYMDGLDE